MSYVPVLKAKKKHASYPSCDQLPTVRAVSHKEMNLQSSKHFKSNGYIWNVYISKSSREQPKVSSLIRLRLNRRVAGAGLTARYCGPSEFSPVRFPHIDAALSCCICCWSCWAMRFCSLSFCVSANFTTMGEEQPCGQAWRGFWVQALRNSKG